MTAHDRRKRYYTVYLAKDDSIAASGTAQECVKQLGMKNLNSFYCMVSLNKKGLHKRYEVYIDDTPEEAYG